MERELYDLVPFMSRAYDAIVDAAKTGLLYFLAALFIAWCTGTGLFKS